MKIALLLVVAAKLLCSSQGSAADAKMDLARVSHHLLDSGDGKKFVIIDSKQKWLYAKEFCEDVVGGNLAAIENQMQYDKLRDFIKKTYSVQVRFWTAGNNILDLSKFQWHLCDSKEMTFHKWSPGQPDNTEKQENCLEAVYNSEKEGWNDLTCTRDRFFICERYH